MERHGWQLVLSGLVIGALVTILGQIIVPKLLHDSDEHPFTRNMSTGRSPHLEDEEDFVLSTTARTVVVRGESGTMPLRPLRGTLVELGTFQDSTGHTWRSAVRTNEPPSGTLHWFSGANGRRTMWIEKDAGTVWHLRPTTP